MALDHDALAAFAASPPFADFLDVEQLVTRPAWMRDALCIEYQALDWFPGRGARIDAQRDVCRRCRVKRECLRFALDDTLTAGVWAGTTADDRRKLRREHDW